MSKSSWERANGYEDPALAAALVAGLKMLAVLAPALVSIAQALIVLGWLTLWTLDIQVGQPASPWLWRLAAIDSGVLAVVGAMVVTAAGAVAYGIAHLGGYRSAGTHH